MAGIKPGETYIGKYAAGETVNLQIGKRDSYTLETLTVLDKDGKELKITHPKDNQYTFTMPSGKVTVTATFMEDNAMLNYCVDVQNSDYFYDAVLWAVQKGVASGIGNGQFSPNADCTRAQIVTFLFRSS